MKWLTLVAVLTPALTLAATPPVGLSHHGRLLDATDTPVNGELDVTFALYTGATGGSAVWQEQWSVTFVNGHYALVLGDPASDGDPIDPALLDQPLWLGITVADGPELAPRQRLAAAAYALRAVRADSVVGGAISGATISGSTIQATALSIGEVPLFDASGAWVAPPGTVPFPDAADVVLRTGDQTMDGALTALRFESTTTDGPPLVVASDARVDNLNAALLDGRAAEDFVDRAAYGESTPFNLARNTSFEDDADGALPQGWTASDPDAAQAAPGGFFGDRALRVEDTGAGAWAGLEVVSPSDAARFTGRRITASVWARRIDGDAVGTLCLAHGAGAAERTCVPLTLGPGWARTTVTHEVGEAPLNVAVRLHAADSGGVATWDFDGLMVTEGSLAPAWSPHLTELLAAGGIGADQLADGSVTTRKLADGAVTADKLGAGAVDSSHFQAGAVDSAALADDAVRSEHLADEAVTAGKLSPGAVGTAHLDAGAVTTPAIGDGQVTTDKLAEFAVTSGKLGPGAVDSAALGDRAVLTDHLNDAAVTGDKLAPGAVGMASLEDGSVTRAKIALGAVDSDRLADDAVISDKLATHAVGSDALAPGAVGTSKIFDGAVTEAKLDTGAVTSTKLGTSAVQESAIADGAVTTSKIRDSAVGTAALADTSVTSAKLAPSAVTSSKLALNAVTTGAVVDGAVTESKLGLGAVTTSRLGDNAVTDVKIADGAVISTKLAADAVGTVALQNGAVTEAKIGLSAVSSSKLADAAVIRDKILDGAVSEAKLASGAVTETRIADGAVSTTKLKDAAVTTDKIGPSAVQSGNIGNLQVITDKLATSAVTTPKIGDGQVTTPKIGDKQVTGAKLADGSVSSGKIVESAVGNMQLADGAVTANKVLAGSLTGDRLANATIPSTKLIQGPGSGVNADLLDDLDSSRFVRTDQSSSIGGDLTVSGAVIAGRLDGPVYPRRSSWVDPVNAGLGNAGAGIVNAADGYQALMIVGSDYGTGRGRWVRVWDHLTVEGSMDVTRGLSTRALKLETANWADHGTGPGGAALYNAPSHSALMIHGADHGVGRGHWVRLWNYLSVHGTVEIDGELLYGGSGTRTQTRDDAATMGGNSGFYETSGPVNYYPGASSWQHLIEARHSNRGNNYALQIAGSFFDQELWYRKTNNNGGTAWQQLVGAGHRGCAHPFNNVGVAISNQVDGIWRTNTICGTVRFGSNSFQEAQLHCWSLGGHVATYTEVYLLGLHYGLPAILGTGDWLGSRGGDDGALCANRNNDQWNFDGNCNKNDSRPWRCIQSFPHVP